MKMKLLDLETGKYLDFYYGGNDIMIAHTTDITDHIQSVVQCYEPDDREAGYYIEKIESDFVERFIETIQPHTNPVINQIAEKVGAVMYGGRYVLLRSEQDKTLHEDNNYYTNGDVVYDKRRGYGYFAICTAETHYSSHSNVLDIPNFQYACECGFLYNKYEVYGNIFEEFAKKEQGIENKFDELQSKIMI